MPDSSRTIGVIATGECVVLATSCAVSLAATFLLAGGAQGRGNPVWALLMPMVVALFRVSLVRYPDQQVSRTRRVGFQLAIGFGLVLLLLFDMAIGCLQLFPNVPAFVLAIITSIGCGYVGLLCLAECLAGRCTSRDDFDTLDLMTESAPAAERPAR